MPQTRWRPLNKFVTITDWLVHGIGRHPIDHAVPARSMTTTNKQRRPHQRNTAQENQCTLITIQAKPVGPWGTRTAGRPYQLHRSRNKLRTHDQINTESRIGYLRIALQHSLIMLFCYDLGSGANLCLRLGAGIEPDTNPSSTKTISAGVVVSFNACLFYLLPFTCFYRGSDESSQARTTFSNECTMVGNS
jgi:hypothetical protein